MPIPQSIGADSSAQQHIYDVFLCHHSGDKPQVEALAARLEDEGGVKPFLDKWHLIPGEPWQEALEEALDRSRTCAVFLGPSGLGPWENEEMRAALDERVRNKSFRVIPVLLPGAEPKDRKTLPRFLSRLTWVDFRGGLDDPETFQRLVAGIQGVPPGRQSALKRIPPIKRKQRRIDAAVPSNCEVGQIIDLLVQARFSDSPQLGIKDWPLKRKPRSLEQGAELAELIFPVNPKTGEVEATRLKIRVVAPDFDVAGTKEKILEVPPDKFSKLLTFLLSAKRAGNCRINVEVYDVTLDCLGTVPIETTVGGIQTTPSANITNFFFVVTTSQPSAGAVKSSNDVNDEERKQPEISPPPNSRDSEAKIQAARISSKEILIGIVLKDQFTGSIPTESPGVREILDLDEGYDCLGSSKDKTTQTGSEQEAQAKLGEAGRQAFEKVLISLSKKREKNALVRPRVRLARIIAYVARHGQIHKDIVVALCGIQSTTAGGELKILEEAGILQEEKRRENTGTLNQSQTDDGLAVRKANAQTKGFSQLYVKVPEMFQG